ncbi:hypothetical protein SEVIR_8G137100v4 [Setaria viridis]|uniref:Uncharacterized protein n=3 Tax=Setaria TaxID=4554 RepID=A0A368S7G5_SETIT|nr:uncharacterized protein LOC101767147 isoform X1 [Setaria italica]XP_034569260.1 uncharacterized protein LOC117833768 isoform X1 [Setaria viridis]RCV38283.1 hypothetical protein SETIT_8G129800v2 [Setaria italica]TKW00821.1 hypothetical protein SEVIR_8G137100v2 [Setaria viridis]
MPPAPARWRRGGRSPLPPRLLQRAFLVAAFFAAALILLILLQHHHGPKPPNPSTASGARAFSDQLPDDSPPAERDAGVGDAAVVGDWATCATVERMGEEAAGEGRGSPEQASLRVREMIRQHFELQGAERVRMLPAHEFCKQGFVLGKASEAGFGNEMYKILTAGALSVMLNRSLIIGQTRGLYPFWEYISYTNQSFTIHEIKHLWRKHHCARTYGRDLNIRVDIFENPAETNVLCSDWNSWKDPIIWFDGTTDAVGIQFFLKNVHPRMKAAALALFGLPDSLHARPNTFGELMRAIISPSSTVQAAVNWALKGANPDIVLHMRMMANRPVRARKAAVLCIKRALQICSMKGTPRVALVSDTPAFVKEIKSDISEFAEVLYFDYKLFTKTSGLEIDGNDKPLNFRSRDWGSAPRWVAFVDFFLAAQAKYAVVTGAHRRVGTTYAQLIAALAAANRHGQEPSGTNFTFLSSVHSNLLVDGLSTQVGWGHIWNRYAGPLSCQRQPHQCALTPLLPPAWWDGQWQSPIPRDVRRLLEYGVRLSNTGKVDERHLVSHCRSRKDHVKRYHVLPPYKNPAR